MNKKVDLIGKLFITYIFLLSLCLLFYALVVLPENGADIVNAKIGLLGWSATIFAPLAAYFLIDNWKDQTKYTEQLRILSSMINEATSLSNNMIDLRADKNLAAYLLLTYDYLTDKNKTIEQIKIMISAQAKEFPCPEINNILKNKKILQDSFLQLKLYSNNNNRLLDLENTIKIFQKYITLYEIYLELAYLTHDSISAIQSNSLQYQNWIKGAFFISATFDSIRNPDKLDIGNQFDDFEGDLRKLHLKIMDYRKILN